jgi:hypothetical protein
MIRDLPFVSKEEILDAYLPVQSSQSRETAFRRLRRENLISAGVALTLRGTGGKVVGRRQIYSALNRDAARLARHGFDEDARDLARAADRLEASDVMHSFMVVLQRVLAERPTESPRLVIHATAGVGKTFLFMELLREMGERNVEVHESLAQILRGMDAVRAQAASLHEIQVKLYGRVTRVEDDLAEVEVSDGRQVVMRVEELEELGLTTPGTPVAVLWERWGKGRVLVESEPAIELPNEGDVALEAAVEYDFDPFSYGEVPVTDGAASELKALLHRPGTLHVPLPVEITSRS